MKKYVLSLWGRLSDNTKIRLISIGNTFAGTFIGTLATSILAAGTLEWSAAFWLGLIVVASREAFKSVVAMFVPVRLGGRKV